MNLATTRADAIKKLPRLARHAATDVFMRKYHGLRARAGTISLRTQSARIPQNRGHPPWFMYFQDHDKMREKETGISLEMLLLCCMHAINTSLLLLTILSFTQKGSHSSPTLPPSLPPTCLCTLAFSLTLLWKRGQKRKKGAGRETVDAAPLVKENASVLPSPLFSSVLTSVRAQKVSPEQ